MRAVGSHRRRESHNKIVWVQSGPKCRGRGAGTCERDRVAGWRWPWRFLVQQSADGHCDSSCRARLWVERVILILYFRGGEASKVGVAFHEEWLSPRRYREQNFVFPACIHKKSDRPQRARILIMNHRLVPRIR
ncbi:uncharacterized protein [Physcomitrium patens]|uniref:uncharacterized protein isoform X2 n=1 Tax=Physcomitrium patens TaxID=3218 RepID=UPI000D15E813|nr:uncharacterized protein LOC112293340 isoform X2 [Physcomitrium patens]|eukprot:XP_024398401.1 uncharacterized protein LOC112293340 isoform X2 [Physcomitrella patens]